MFKEVTAEPGYPHNLVEMGSCLPKDGIDTALRWEPMGKTYFFKGDQYWRYNEEKRTADPGYPKPITVWKGIPEGPQGAFISREGCECQLAHLSKPATALTTTKSCFVQRILTKHKILASFTQDAKKGQCKILYLYCTRFLA